MKKILFISLIFAVASVVYSQNSGLNLRGRILTIDPAAQNQKYIPLNKALVVLYAKGDSSDDWKPISKTVSDKEGYFFFYDVAVGTYYIQVNEKKNFKINVYSAKGDYQIQDMPTLYY
jgi:hypothetical protein